MARNLETLLESRMLDDLPADLIKQFSAFIREEQQRKSPLSRSTRLVDAAMAKNKAWLELQDFPQPIVRSVTTARPPPVGRKRSVGASPVDSPAVRPLTSCRPTQAVQAQDGADDGVFVMDGVDAIPPLSLGQPQVSKSASLDAAQKGSAGWKVLSSAPKYVSFFFPALTCGELIAELLFRFFRVDMKAIMAEAETSAKVTSSRPQLTATASVQPRQPSAASDTPNWRTPQRKPVALPPDSPTPGTKTTRAPTGSPWKSVPSSVVNLASSAGHSPVPTPPLTPLMRATKLREDVPAPVAPSLSKSQPSQTQMPTQTQRPGMGPMFSPAKQSPVKSSPSSGVRRAS